MKYVVAILMLSILIVGCESSGNTGPNQIQTPEDKSEISFEIIRFNAYPLSIAKGEDVVLTWDVKGADKVILDGNNVSSDGSLHIKLSHTTTYVLIAEKKWSSISKAVTIEVKDDNQPKQSQPPTKLSSDNLTSLLYYGDIPVSIFGLFNITPTENVTAKIENAYYVGFQEAFQKGWKEGYQKGEEVGHSSGYDSGYDSGYSDCKSKRRSPSYPNSYDVPSSIDRNTDPVWSYRHGYDQGFLDAAKECR